MDADWKPDSPHAMLGSCWTQSKATFGAAREFTESVRAGDLALICCGTVSLNRRQFAQVQNQVVPGAQNMRLFRACRRS